MIYLVIFYHTTFVSLVILPCSHGILVKLIHFFVSILLFCSFTRMSNRVILNYKSTTPTSGTSTLITGTLWDGWRKRRKAYICAPLIIFNHMVFFIRIWIISFSNSIIVLCVFKFLLSMFISFRQSLFLSTVFRLEKTILSFILL